MKKVLVIGIGSRIMTDDAIGIYLVEDLIRQGKKTDVTYIIGETDVDYCIEEVLDFEHVIVIDACISGKQPGEITVIPLEELEYDDYDCSNSAHGMHLLSQMRRRKYSGIFQLIGIEPYEIKYGFKLSSPLQKCYFHILSEVGMHICKFIDKNGGRKNA